MPWFDIGVNLTNPRLPLPDVINQAHAAGVTQLAITGTSVADSQQAAQLAAEYNVVSTAGIHPHYASDAPSDYIAQLTQLAAHSHVVAIGECGLDFNRNFSTPEQQIVVFRAQLALAEQLAMPVFLHERDAFEQQLTCLDAHPGLPGVAHCFTGSLEQMQAYLQRGLYIGITGWLCDEKRGGALREAVPHLPLDKLLLETDAPYLLPKRLPGKHKFNQPANLPWIAEQLAALMHLEPATLMQHSYANACRLFGVTQDSPYAA